MGLNNKNDTPPKTEANDQPEKLQPWKANWPPKESVHPVSNSVQEGQKMVIMGGGGAYPNTIKHDEGRRL